LLNRDKSHAFWWALALEGTKLKTNFFQLVINIVEISESASTFSFSVEKTTLALNNAVQRRNRTLYRTCATANPYLSTPN